MSNLGYLSEKREKQLAKFLDATIDFDKLFGSQTILFGLIRIGSFIEKRDRMLFLSAISYLDDYFIGKNPKQEVVKEIENIFVLLENRDINGFTDAVSEILTGIVDIPLVECDKQIFTGLLSLMNGIIGRTINKVKSITAKADAEA